MLRVERNSYRERDDWGVESHGSTNRSSASYKVSLVPKTAYEPLRGFIKYE